MTTWNVEGVPDSNKLSPSHCFGFLAHNFNDVASVWSSISLWVKIRAGPIIAFPISVSRQMYTQYTFFSSDPSNTWVTDM